MPVDTLDCLRAELDSEAGQVCSDIDELFEGDRASIAKNRARNMASNLFMAVYQHRQPE